MQIGETVPATIELPDNIPGMVIEPLDLPEREIPEDWDVFGKDDE